MSVQTADLSSSGSNTPTVAPPPVVKTSTPCGSKDVSEEDVYFKLSNRVAPNEGHLSRLEAAYALIGYEATALDLEMMLGIPMRLGRPLARMARVGSLQPGRKPATARRIFSSHATHLRMSVFLCVMVRISPDLICPDTRINGFHVLSAMRAMDMICGPGGEDELGLRWSVMVITKYKTGDLMLRKCSKCKVTHLVTKVGFKSQGGNYIRGDHCPYCAYLVETKLEKDRLKRLKNAPVGVPQPRSMSFEEGVTRLARQRESTTDT